METPIDPHIYSLMQDRKVVRKKIALILGIYIIAVALLAYAISFIFDDGTRAVLGLILVVAAFIAGGIKFKEFMKIVDKSNRLTADIKTAQNSTAWKALQKQQKEQQRLIAEIFPEQQ